ncbi:Outer membrane protein TolC [Spirosomataceae bacterium TFI 002]|nr:Outer membrane protein TolC [Spirosomataceae bacterium TFI 002]
MKVKKIMIASFLGLFSLGLNAQGISLDFLQEKAKSNNPQTALLPLIQEATNLQIKQLQGAYLPQASLGGQATWQSDVTSLPISLPNIEIAPPPNDQYKVTLDIQQSIWDGGITSSQKKIATSQGLVEAKSTELSLLKVEEQVNSLFFGAILAKKQLNNVNILLEDLNGKLKIAEAGLANGILVKTDVLNLKAAQIEALQNKDGITMKLSGAMEALTILTGEAMNEATVFVVQPSIFDLNQNQRPELDLLNLQQQTLGAQSDLIYSKYKPKVSLFATGGYGRPGLNFLSSTFDTYFLGGVQLKVPLSQLYNGGKYADLQQVKIGQLKLDQQKANFEMMTDVQKASLTKEIERIQHQLTSDDELIEIRKTVKETAEAQLANGVITSEAYLEIANKENLANEMKILHEVQLLQAKENLKTLLGQ